MLPVEIDVEEPSRIYGTFGQKSAKHGRSWLRAYMALQQVVACVAATGVLCLVVARAAVFLRSRQAAPPAAGAGPASCAAYTYPQCQHAIISYLHAGARDRCEAFERVRAEGDLTRYPFAPLAAGGGGEESCGAPGCCGCPGQCNRCPPLLTECESWQLDGLWRVAFADGTAARYTIDAHGHCELEIPARSLPISWTPVHEAYLPAGSEAGIPKRLSVPEAQAHCASIPSCLGMTYNVRSGAGDRRYAVYFKTVRDTVRLAASGWESLINNRRAAAEGQVAIVGPLLRAANSTITGTVRLDLHAAAPGLFPEGSFDRIGLADGELRVERWVRGAAALNGTGILVQQ